MLVTPKAVAVTVVQQQEQEGRLYARAKKVTGFGTLEWSRSLYGMLFTSSVTWFS